LDLTTFFLYIEGGRITFLVIAKGLARFAKGDESEQELDGGAFGHP
jgi:hypothetical protein